jgi:hypothetical protein
VNNDYSVCPFCKRKLLALASIACNYCGRALPADLLHIRQGLAKTLVEQAGKSYYTESGSHDLDASTVPSLLAALGIEFQNNGSDVRSLLEQLGIKEKDDNSINPPPPDSTVFRRIGH